MDAGPGCFPPVEPHDDPALRSRLAASHVAVIGCGGLGSNAAMMLVRCGVGELTLVDFDVVEESNLNRQMFFRDQLGMPKTEALRETLLRINPDTVIHSHQVCATAENLATLAAGVDVVIEAADRAEVKAMIIGASLDTLPGTPLVSASGLAGFDSANEVVTERMADDLYMVGDLRSDVREGHSLFASRVMVAAAHEAHAAVRILLGYPEP